MSTTNINLLERVHKYNLTPEVLTVIHYIGTNVTQITNDYHEDDVEYQFPDSKETLLILGDDNWGAVTGAYADDGHLVLIANYGDEGDYKYSFTSDVHNKIDLTVVSIVTLLSELPLQVPEDY